MTIKYNILFVDLFLNGVICHSWIKAKTSLFFDFFNILTNNFPDQISWIWIDILFNMIGILLVHFYLIFSIFIFIFKNFKKPFCYIHGIFNIWCVMIWNNFNSFEFYILLKHALFCGKQSSFRIHLFWIHLLIKIQMKYLLINFILWILFQAFFY